MSSYQEGEREKKEERLREQAIKEQYLRLFLTPDARERLTNVKMVRPEVAEQVENYIIQLGLSGKLPRPINDDELKELLYKFTPRRREIRFKFM